MRRLGHLRLSMLIIGGLVGGCTGAVSGADGWRIGEHAADSATEVASGGETAGPPPRIAVGFRHTCAAATTGRVYCWGAPKNGRLGTGQRRPVGNDGDLVAVPDIRTAKTVGAGFLHSCAVMREGTVRCWGDNGFGQLGNGHAGARRQTATPVDVDRLESAVAVSAGKYHTCALSNDGRVWCWGRNTSGLLGIGKSGHEIRKRSSPSLVVDLDDVTDISTGSNHNCALRADGRVFCWGHGYSGQLGRGERGDQAHGSARPRPVPGIQSAIDIATGDFFSCAALADGSVRCWGENECDVGICEHDPLIDSAEPVEVSGIDQAVEISAGLYHVCARRRDDRATCWGANRHGRLGTGSDTTPKNGFVRVPNIDRLQHISAGQFHTCGQLRSGSIRCWGHVAPDTNRDLDLSDEGTD